MNISETNLKDIAIELINHCAVIKEGKITLPEEELNNLIERYITIDKANKPRKKSLFKFQRLLSEEHLKNDSIVFVISEEQIQGEAESAGIERRLTDDELLEIGRSFYEDDDLAWQLMAMIREAIGKVVDY